MRTTLCCAVLCTAVLHVAKPWTAVTALPSDTVTCIANAGTPRSLHHPHPLRRCRCCTPQVTNNPAYPNVASWFRAMLSRPAYQKVRSDEHTLRLLFTKTGLKPLPPPEPSAKVAAARQEAASKLNANREAIIDDIVMNAGGCTSRQLCNCASVQTWWYTPGGPGQLRLRWPPSVVIPAWQ